MVTFPGAEERQDDRQSTKVPETAGTLMTLYAQGNDNSLFSCKITSLRREGIDVRVRLSRRSALQFLFTTSAGEVGKNEGKDGPSSPGQGAAECVPNSVKGVACWLVRHGRFEC